MTLFVQQLVNGLSLGAIYALIALGYTMVYGTLQMINFAHSEVFMMGGFFALLIAKYSGVADAPSVTGVIFVAVATMASTAALGVGIERLAYRPLRKSGRLNMLITAIGMSLLLQNGALLVWGTNVPFPELLPRTTWVIAGVSVSTNNVLVFGVTIVLMIALHHVVERTQVGRAMRAVSASRDAAALMGIPVDRIIAFTFALGSTLAGAASMLWVLDNPRVDPAMGIMPGLKAFVAAVLGGIGSIPGAVAGAILLGLCETMVSGYVSSTWRDAVAFLLLIVILLVRPAGLFGKFAPEKV
ncbi:MAG: branched-chain amino acid ABC transporter permease [Myxococcales bacterium]|nr:branched-chain amino acid ABC transporter permease [Myxococcales bacterium]